MLVLTTQYGEAAKNNRGEHIMDFIAETNLAVLNQSTKPMFKQHRGLGMRVEVLNIMLAD